MPEIGYEVRQPAPKIITLEVEADSVCLTLPPPPRWLTMGGPISGLVMMSAQVAIFAMIMRRTGFGLIASAAHSMKTWAWIVFDIVGFTLAFALAIYEVVQQSRFGTATRQIRISGGYLTYSRPGLLRFRLRKYPVSEITRIRLRRMKGLTRKMDAVQLIFQIGRWRKIRVLFRNKSLHLAADAERAFNLAVRMAKSESVVV